MSVNLETNLLGFFYVQGVSRSSSPSRVLALVRGTSRSIARRFVHHFARVSLLPSFAESLNAPCEERGFFERFSGSFTFKRADASVYG